MKMDFLILPLLMGGCAQFTVSTLGNPSVQTRADLAATCEGGANCRFVNSPVQVDRSQMRRIASRKVPFYPTLAQLDFVDGSGATWVAPKGIVTDGASIPPIFVSIIGDPTSPEFVNAAAVHDAYCGIGNEQGLNFQTATWQRVHIMFYDALRVGGVPEIKAKLMFAAVWLGGPRWGDVEFLPSEQPRAPMQAAMQRTRLFVEGANPTIPALIEYISGEEGAVRRAAALAGPGTGVGGAGGNDRETDEASAPSTEASPSAPGSAPDEGTDGDGTGGEGTDGEGTGGEGTGSEGTGSEGTDGEGTAGSVSGPQ